jgi:sulfite exporter TauE/SafE
MMHPADFSLVFLFGLVSSLHCLQMCGPIVLTYSVSANTAASGHPLLGLHLAYNAGRTLTYMLLGAAAGAAGGAIGWMGHLAGVENIAAVVAGLAMMVTGIAMLGFGPGLERWKGVALPGRLLRPAGRLIASPAASSKFQLGLMLGFLPCGQIYAALMKAVGTASSAGGALTMLAFGLGTSLALIAVGVGSSAITQKAARWGMTLAGVTVLIMGVILVGRAFLAHTMHHCGTPVVIS